MSRRSGVLELAVLGLLHESPLHGYELRKRVNTLLGPLRAISYGSLYPCLKEMTAAGLIAADVEASESGAGRRSRIVNSSRRAAGSSTCRPARLLERSCPGPG